MKLRIISGIYGGRFISAPKSNLTRPTTEKVKGAIFNSLSNFFDFEEALVLDIYAGSGALGFEALSRGAKEIHFVEKNFVPLENLRNNIKNLEVEDQCKVFKDTAVRYLNNLNLNRYDLILADPPFFEFDIHQVYNKVVNGNILSENGFLLIERSVQTFKQDFEVFKIEPYKIIGDSYIYLHKNTI
ncbi:MAG: 16S rRNA (guanine(966)-N(2))-methyltransferase RsmD [Ignavibacteriaceae bacterium]|nr:16S rRNA (guanine(966)-N(2))-methyltransferase RsmD [Ignavibacteriaceae bacterium]